MLLAAATAAFVVGWWRYRSIPAEIDQALKVLYLVATGRRPNRSNPTGRISGWKQMFHALTIHYGDRIKAAH